jgi:hypothetical protein
LYESGGIAFGQTAEWWDGSEINDLITTYYSVPFQHRDMKKKIITAPGQSHPAMSHVIHMHISLGNTAGRNKRRKREKEGKNIERIYEKINKGNNHLGRRRPAEGFHK